MPEMTIGDGAYCIYMDRMTRMPERFKTLKEAEANWLTVSDDVRTYYEYVVRGFLALQSCEYPKT